MELSSLEKSCGSDFFFKPDLDLTFQNVRIRLITLKSRVAGSVAEPELESEPPGAAIFRAELEPIFWSVGAKSRSRLFKAAPAPSCRKAKKKSLFLVLGMHSVQFVPIYRY